MPRNSQEAALASLPTFDWRSLLLSPKFKEDASASGPKRWAAER